MIGKILRELRNSKGLTISQSAEVFGVASRTYSSYEAEEREPNLALLNKIANYYGVTTDYLLGREPAPDPFGELHISQQTEQDVLQKYMSLPDTMRAVLLDVLRQLGDVVEAEREITETTTAGVLHDRLAEEAEAEDAAG